MMDKSLFAMASEWMENGNINQFIEAHKDVNRFELVRVVLPPQTTPVANAPLVAQRCRPGVEVSTRSGDGTWGLEGGMVSDYRRYPLTLSPFSQGEHPD